VGETRFYLTVFGAALKVKGQHSLRCLSSAKQGSKGSYSFPTPQYITQCAFFDGT